MLNFPPNNTRAELQIIDPSVLFLTPFCYALICFEAIEATIPADFEPDPDLFGTFAFLGGKILPGDIAWV